MRQVGAASVGHFMPFPQVRCPIAARKRAASRHRQLVCPPTRDACFHLRGLVDIPAGWWTLSITAVPPTRDACFVPTAAVPPTRDACFVRPPFGLA